MYNTIRSTPDDRDYIFENRRNNLRAADVPLPTSLDLRPQLNKPRNQGSRGTCAAFAGSCCLEFQENRSVGSTSYFSPEFIYNNRQGAPNGAGMSGRDVMDILLNKGCVPDFKFPYQSKDTSEPVQASIMKQALQYKIDRYAQVTTLEGLKSALITNGAVMACFPVYKNRPEFWKQSDPSEQSTGGHAVTITGYDDSKACFIIRNSWGSTWNGDGYVNFSYVDFGAQWELWTISSFNKTPVPNAPPMCCGNYCSCIIV